MLNNRFLFVNTRKKKIP